MSYNVNPKTPLQQLAVPNVLVTRILNEFLSFVESRRNGAGFAVINRWWNESRKLADKQMTHLQIAGDVAPAMHILHKQAFSRLRSISMVNMNISQVNALFALPELCLPPTVVTLRVEAVEESFLTKGFVKFIKRNQQISTIYFNACFDNLTCGSTANRLAEAFNHEHPLKSRIQVGEFVTLQPACLSTTRYPYYRLRWVCQCPCNKCPERFCWGRNDDCYCPAGHDFVDACCAKYKFTTPRICAMHWKQCFVQTAEGRFICQDCHNQAIISDTHNQ